MRKSKVTDIEKLSKLPDLAIDYSDIPETDVKFWSDAVVEYPVKKVHLSIRLDEDIVDWFRRFGKGYQTKINAVLRSYVSNVKGKKLHRKT